MSINIIYVESIPITSCKQADIILGINYFGVILGCQEDSLFNIIDDLVDTVRV